MPDNSVKFGEAYVEIRVKLAEYDRRLAAIEAEIPDAGRAALLAGRPRLDPIDLNRR